MTIELRDIRARITVESDQVLNALSHARGIDKSELVREILSEFAARQIHEATLVLRLTAGERQGREER